MILGLLKAASNEMQEDFEILISKIGKNPNTAWYPSSGNDFRDLIEANRTKTRPDLFIHTDYNSAWIKFECGEVFNDGRTQVIITNVIELEFKEKINYFINPDFVTFSELANPTPRIYVLDVEIDCSFGLIKKPVVYFFMENINFLDEILLKNKIKISHIFKVREGCGFGGNRKSISVAYAFLGNLKVKHVIVDDEEQTDKDLINTIAEKHHIRPEHFFLKNASQRRNIANWSGLGVKVLDVHIGSHKSLTDEALNEILSKIRGC